MSARQRLILTLFIVVPIIAGIIFSIADKTSGSDSLAHMGQKKIGEVVLEDVIYSSQDIVDQLKEYRTDNSVAGVLFRVDSPGGAVAPSQEIWQEVCKYRDENKPLIVSMGNLAASGGYYVSCPAERIFANPGTLTGSIGVIMQFPQYYKLLEKVGVSMVTLKAGAMKDAGNPNREMTPEEKELLETIMQNTHEQFLRAVSDGRDINIDTLRTFADGRIINGEQALAYGLIDTLGGYEDALAFAKQTCGLDDDAPVVRDEKPEAFIKDLLTESLSDLFPMLKHAKPRSGAYFMSELY